MGCGTQIVVPLCLLVRSNRKLRLSPFLSLKPALIAFVGPIPPSDLFDGRSVYKLARGEEDISEDFIGNWIWKVDAQPKIQCFGRWRWNYKGS